MTGSGRAAASRSTGRGRSARYPQDQQVGAGVARQPGVAAGRRPPRRRRSPASAHAGRGRRRPAPAAARSWRCRPATSTHIQTFRLLQGSLRPGRGRARPADGGDAAGPDRRHGRAAAPHAERKPGRFRVSGRRARHRARRALPAAQPAARPGAGAAAGQRRDPADSARSRSTFAPRPADDQRRRTPARNAAAGRADRHPVAGAGAARPGAARPAARRTR